MDRLSELLAENHVFVADAMSKTNRTAKDTDLSIPSGNEKKASQLTVDPPVQSAVDFRLAQICLWAGLLGVLAAVAAQCLTHLIALITNAAFFQRYSWESVSPAANQLGWWVVIPPLVGAFVIGLMARFGSPAIRGHGIPEAMEQILTNESRIAPRLTWLKPLSAAISIGTGGPFGSEGPIIATGGALGSLVGQLIRTTAFERKTLLAAGAAAGMAATFGAPVAAVLLAVELLLFEFRPKSLIPVALASVVAAGIRMMIEGMSPVFSLPNLDVPSGAALLLYVAIGALMGIVAAGLIRLTFGVEDLFELLPIHWMWWPLLGALAVGVTGYFVPRTLGVGYENISDALSAKFFLQGALVLAVAKLLSWSIALGSGTSGGTLAPLLTIGAGLGLCLGQLLNEWFPGVGVDPRLAALVGMAALFAGASRALLASAVFAFETTLQPVGLLPLLGACSTAYLVAALLSRNSIMTERIARRGIHVPLEYLADYLDQVHVADIASHDVVTLRSTQTVAEIIAWLDSDPVRTRHQGYPVIDDAGMLIGVITRRNVLAAQLLPSRPIAELLTRPPVYVYDTSTARDAADHMVRHDVGRLPVVSRHEPRRIAGIITRSDILSVYERRVRESVLHPPMKSWKFPRRSA